MLPIDEVGIGQIGRQHAIVVRQVGAKEQRLKAVDPDFEVRQIARVAKKQTVRFSEFSPDVTVRIHDQKGITMLHDVPRPRRRDRHRDLEGRLDRGFSLSVC